MDQSAFILRTTALVLLLLPCVTTRVSFIGIIGSPNSGRITAIKVWEELDDIDYYSTISGVQFKYSHTRSWSEVFGKQSNYSTMMALEDDDEDIIQISGKGNEKYIYQLYFMTNKGRMLIAGQPIGYSFNYYYIH